MGIPSHACSHISEKSGISKTRRVSPVDGTPFSNQLHHSIQRRRKEKNYDNVTCDIGHVKCERYHMTHVVGGGDTNSLEIAAPQLLQFEKHFFFYIFQICCQSFMESIDFQRISPQTDSFQQSRCVYRYLSIGLSTFHVIYFQASHWPSDYMIRSRPLIGRPPKIVSMIMEEICFKDFGGNQFQRCWRKLVSKILEGKCFKYFGGKKFQRF